MCLNLQILEAIDFMSDYQPKGGYAEVYKACHKGKVMGRGTWGGGAGGDTRMTQRERVMGDTEGGDTGEGTHGEGSVQWCAV